MQNKIDNIDLEIKKNLRFYTSKIRDIPEKIIITNYSGILTCYDLLLNVSYQILTKIILVIQPFWLDSVHESRLDSWWGQNFREFPLTISRLLLEMDPDIKNQERITFRQVQQLRRMCIDILKGNNHFEVIEGKCHSLQLMREKVKRKSLPLPQIELFETSIKPVEKLAAIRAWNQIEYVKIQMENNQEYLYELTHENKIYNFSQQPIEDFTKPYLPPQTLLYQLPKGQEPANIIVLGAGLSAVWILEQAPASKVRIAIRDNVSKVAPTIARNKNNPIIKEACLKLDQCYLLSLKSIMESKETIDRPDQENIKNYSIRNQISIKNWASNDIVAIAKQTREILDIGSGYTAYGFSTEKSLTKKLPENMVVSLEKPVDPGRFYAPKNIPFDAFFARHQDQKKLLMQDKFSISDINLSALVIQEEDKSTLALALNVDIHFMHYLCNKIIDKSTDNFEGLEDTPEDSQQFIKDIYSLWIQEYNQIDNSLDFHTKLADIFQKMEENTCLPYKITSSK